MAGAPPQAAPRAGSAAAARAGPPHALGDRALGHDSEDRVVAADAGAVLLVVLLGVTHLKELGLREAAVRAARTPSERRRG